MTRDRSRSPDTPLDEREAAVLRSVIRAHIQTGGPVGSRAISRGAWLNLSAASIRSIMAELEAQGLLMQPHTSAGRIPTDSAYRLYVDCLLGNPRVASAHAEKIDAALASSRGELAELLAEASRQLSQFSHQVGLVLAPGFRRIVVEHLEFLRLDSRRVVAILIGQSGVVQHCVLPVEEELDQIELDRIGRYLSEQFGGQTLPEMRAALVRRLSEARRAYDRLLARSLELGRRTLEVSKLGGEVFVEGASNLLGSPEFSDLDQMKQLLRTLEEKSRLVELLGRLLESKGVQVVIGEENPVSALARCSLVASTYGSESRVMGTVGIVGPTRMEYSRAIALVGHLARVLTRLLSNPGEDV